MKTVVEFVLCTILIFVLYGLGYQRAEEIYKRPAPVLKPLPKAIPCVPPVVKKPDMTFCQAQGITFFTHKKGVEIEDAIPITAKLPRSDRVSLHCAKTNCCLEIDRSQDGSIFNKHDDPKVSEAIKIPDSIFFYATYSGYNFYVLPPAALKALRSLQKQNN